MIVLSYMLIAVGLIFMSVDWNLRWWAKTAVPVIITGLFLLLPLHLLGISKPVHLHRQSVEEATVLSWYVDGREAIHMWLLVPGDKSPRSFVYPWTQEAHQKLQDTQEQADGDGTGVKMKLPFEHSWDDRPPMLYTIPQPKDPEKPTPPSVPEMNL